MAAFRATLRRLRAAPRTVVAGAALVAVDLASAGVVALATPLLPAYTPALALAGFALAQVVWVPLATPVLVAGYRLAAGERSQAAVGDAIADRGPGVFAALVAERGVALGLAVVAVPLVAGAVLGLHTLAKAAWYAVDPTAGVAPMKLVTLVGVAAVAAGPTLARLPVAFAAPLVALDGEAGTGADGSAGGRVDRRDDADRRDGGDDSGAGIDARVALARSVRIVRTCPVAALRYWLVGALLGLPLFLFVGLVAVVDRPAYLPVALTYAVLAGPGRTVALAYRAESVERVDVTAARTVPRAPSPARMALAVALVVALVAGVGFVRTTETQPSPTPAASVGGEKPDPAALFAAGARNLRGSSFRQVTRTTAYNASTGEEEGRLVWRWAVDRRRKRVRMRLRSFHSNGTRTGNGFESYMSESVFAQAIDEDGPRASSPRVAPLSVRRTTGRWFVTSAPAYAIVHRPVGREKVPAEDGPWRVVDNSGGNVTLAVTGSAVGRVSSITGDVDYPAAEDSYVRVTFDRETGRLLRVEERLRTAPDADVHSRLDRRRVTTYTDYGETEVRRPAGLGPRPILEWLWDLAYY